MKTIPLQLPQEVSVGREAQKGLAICPKPHSYIEYKELSGKRHPLLSKG